VRVGGEVRFFKPVNAAKPPAIKTGPLQSAVSCRFLRKLIQEELSQMLEADDGHDSNEARCTRGLDWKSHGPLRLALMANPHETVERLGA
jgi:hypothetical protein